MIMKDSTKPNTLNDSLSVVVASLGFDVVIRSSMIGFTDGICDGSFVVNAIRK